MQSHWRKEWASITCINRWQCWEPETPEHELTINTHTPRSRLFKQHEFIMKCHEVWTERGKESCFYKRIKGRYREQAGCLKPEYSSVPPAAWSENTSKPISESNKESLCSADAHLLLTPQDWELMCRAVWCFSCVIHTTGSHPSIILAFRMSGLLLCGSSWASGRNWIWLRLTVVEGTD